MKDLQTPEKSGSIGTNFQKSPPGSNIFKKEVHFLKAQMPRVHFLRQIIWAAHTVRDMDDFVAFSCTTFCFLAQNGKSWALINKIQIFKESVFFSLRIQHSFFIWTLRKKSADINNFLRKKYIFFFKIYNGKMVGCHYESSGNGHNR